MSAPEGTTRLGHFMGPQGLKGGAKLFVVGEPEQVLALPRVWVEGWGWLKVRRAEPTYPGVALFLAGIDTREAAADLRDLQVYAADAELPQLEAGCFYYHNLRGLEFWRSQAGKDEYLGEVIDVLDMGHQDLLQVSHALGESLVPLQAPYVRVEETDGLPSRIFLTADAPKGLLGDAPAAEETTELDG